MANQTDSLTINALNTNVMDQSNLNGLTPSRLLTSTNGLRNVLVNRNLYTPNSEYPIPASDISKTVSAISNIIDTILPFKSIDLENTVIGRLVTDRTPISTIGLTMLGKQFALNSESDIIQKDAPILNKSNLLNFNNLFSKNIDYSITKKTGTTTINDFINVLVGFNTNLSTPFKPTSTNSDYIENTGDGQLLILYNNINNNVYKPQKDKNSSFYTHANNLNVAITTPKSIISNTEYFNWIDDKFNPYKILRYLNNTAINTSSKSLINSIERISSVYDEYAPNSGYINTQLGSTIKSDSDTNAKNLGNSSDIDINNWIDDNTEFKDDKSKKIVWGRDGIISETQQYLNQLQGLNGISAASGTSTTDLSNSFNVNGGLLEYTRNLINSTVGMIGDTTRKAFTNGSELIGFNGSGLWKAPSTSLSDFRKKTGVRQHSPLDPYESYTKAIRFNGNNVYVGNKDSVIYNSVLPRIHPTLNKNGTINNKNLMFSLENLASHVVSKSNVGILDDGSQIPISEVGPFNGRIMWFPPYGMELQENLTAKYESTVMVGRNEPMYNYQNSERSATLSFILLVDYPMHLTGYDKQKEIAEFFAFGGTDISVETRITDLEKKQNDIQNQINLIKKSSNTSVPNGKTSTYYIYFPNDVPSLVDNLNYVIDSIYEGEYEVLPNIKPFDYDGVSYGLNKSIYFINGLESYDIGGKIYYRVVSATTSQYDATDTSDIYGGSGFNKALRNVFDNEDQRKYYTIEIIGATSKLFTSEYNMALGQRRADATRILIEKRLEAMYGKSITDLGIKITTQSVGESTATSSTSSSKSGIPDKATKMDRHAEIRIIRNNNAIDSKDSNLTPEQIQTLNTLQSQLEEIKNQLNRAKALATKGIMNERTISGDSISHGFSSIGKNYFNPVFHSQTPEDFHKRLTFLNQCVRQGSAKRYSSFVDNGVLRARNSVFGRQPICILRIGDLFYTKVVIETINIDYTDTTWDTNPEGFGMQPLMAKVTINMKVIGGQSLKGPIDALQNAISFNMYANSTFTDKGLYKLPSGIADMQYTDKNGITAAKSTNLNNTQTK